MTKLLIAFFTAIAAGIVAWVVAVIRHYPSALSEVRESRKASNAEGMDQKFGELRTEGEGIKENIESDFMQFRVVEGSRSHYLKPADPEHYQSLIETWKWHVAQFLRMLHLDDAELNEAGRVAQNDQKKKDEAYLLYNIQGPLTREYVRLCAVLQELEMIRRRLRERQDRQGDDRMSETAGPMEKFEKMVDKVLACRPKKARKKKKTQRRTLNPKGKAGK